MPSPSAEPAAPGLSICGRFSVNLAEAAWLGLVLIVPLVMNVAATRTFEAAKLAAAAPLAAILLFALIAAAIEGRASMPLAVRQQTAFWAFLALMASAVTASAMSETPWIAFFGDYFRREGLVSWLIYATVFVAIVALMRQRDQFERLINALLLASIIPCIYAVQQRYGYDFFSTAGLGGGTVAARPGSNFGNPSFLSAHLLLIIPLTIARLVNTTGSWSARSPWLILLGLQLFAAILTQSRGPLLGMIATLFLLAIALGGQLKLRGLIYTACGIVVLIFVGLLLINLVPDLQGLVKNTPLQRFIFTSGQDFSSNSRIGIWQMGVDAFLHMPLWRQLVGAGPDAAHFNYFPYLPSWVLHIEGMDRFIDRLHNEGMETAMTFGLAGLFATLILWSSLVWLAARWLGQWSSRAAPVAYVIACVVVTLAAGSALMAVGGSRGLFAIGAGLGIAIAWSITLIAASWRALAVSEHSMSRADAVLLLALACALVGSWIEAQVGVPTISTRLLTAVYAALMLLLGSNALASTSTSTNSPVAPAPTEVSASAPYDHGSKPAAALYPQPPAVAGWLSGLALIVATVAYFPPLFDSIVNPPSLVRLTTIIVPLFGLIIGGCFLAWSEGRRTGAALPGALARYFVSMAAPWLIFFLSYLLIGSVIAEATVGQVGERINNLLMFAFGTYPTVVFAMAIALYRPGQQKQPVRQSNLWAIVTLVASMLAGTSVYWAVMIDVRADTYTKLAEWAKARNQPDTATALYQAAAELLPQERRFTSAYAAILVQRSEYELGLLAGSPSLGPEALERLYKAEALNARGLQAAPRDPWMTLAYARTRQLQGSSLLDNYQSKEQRARHLELARQYFGIARTQFPASYLPLRNLAFMEIDVGDYAAAYTKFDEMQNLYPQNMGMYTERLRFAFAHGDHASAIDALRRGIAAQPAGSTGEIDIKLLLANYFYQIRQAQQALDVWIDVLRTQPDNFSVFSNIVETYAQMGRRELALRNAQAGLARLATMPRTDQTDAAKVRLEALIAYLVPSSASR